MTQQVLDFARFKLAASYTPASDTTITVIATSEIYDLALQRQGGNLTAFRFTVTEKTDTTQQLRIGLEDVASTTVVNGKNQYVVNIRESDASNLMVGLANDDSGTNADANIIATNLSGLSITTFSKDSSANLVVGSGEYNNLLSSFTATTTTETVTAGEIIDSTASNLGVSIHTDGKYYKYHNVNYPNYQGVILAGQTIAADGSFTLYNLKAIVTGFTSMGNTFVYVDNGGTYTVTSSATTVLAGIARDDVVVVGAERAPTAIEASAAESRAMTDTGVFNAPLGTAYSIQEGTPIYAADGGSSDTYAITLTPTLTALTTGMVIRFKANTVNTGAATLNVDTLGAKDIVKSDDTTLVDGDIQANQIVEVVYNGTKFQMISPSGIAATATEVAATELSANSGTSSLTAVSTARTITHGLGKTPKLIRVTMERQSQVSYLNTGASYRTGDYTTTGTIIQDVGIGKMNITVQNVGATTFEVISNSGGGFYAANFKWSAIA